MLILEFLADYDQIPSPPAVATFYFVSADGKTGRMYIGRSDGSLTEYGGGSGSGLMIAGSAATTEDLPESAPSTDVWLVGGHLYSYDGEEWIDHGEFRGPAGADGREAVFRNYEGTLQWQHVGDTDWIDLASLPEPVVPDIIDGGTP
jgi:hypothetical protein